MTSALCDELQDLADRPELAAYAYLPRSLLSLCRVKTGQASAAPDLARMAVTQAPDLVWTHAALARAALAAGLLAEAEEAASAAVSLSDFPAGLLDIDMHLKLARCYKSAFQFRKAFDQLRYVLDASAVHHEGWLEIQEISKTIYELSLSKDIRALS